jgi:hypothetical protein
MIKKEDNDRMSNNADKDSVAGDARWFITMDIMGYQDLSGRKEEVK